jgi:pilus assembly protein Flp/PilA
MIRKPEGLKTMFNISSMTICRPILRFARDESGATAIEYAMIASGVGVAIAAAVVNLGSGVKGMFVSVSSALK